MDIHQLQASYQADQDRILLRLNTHSGEEMRVWLTRRMLKGVIGHVQRLADHIGTLHKNMQRKPDPHAQSTDGSLHNDFATAFEDALETTLPLGEQPLLTTALHVTPAPENSLHVRFDEVADGQSVAQRSVEMTLGPEMLVGLVQVLDAVLKLSDWGLVLHSHLPLPPMQEHAATPIDAFTHATKPKYLN